MIERIAEHGISDDLTMAIIQRDERTIIRQMLLTKLIDYPSFPRKTFRLKFGAKTCPHCKGTIDEGRQAVFDGHDRISHPSCYGAIRTLMLRGLPY